jgi:hypothetical protein
MALANRGAIKKLNLDMKATFVVATYTSSNLSTKGIIDVPFMFC